MPATSDWPPTRYFAWLYYPPPQRPLVENLFAIEREVASSLRPGLDHQVAHTRLQWWREECQRCAAGHPVHPLTRALVAAAARLSAGPVPLEGLSGLVDAAVWDLAGATFESRRELAAYCGRWATAIIRPMLQAAGAQIDWQTLGTALRELELLVQVAHEAQAGRLRLPLDELQLAGVEPESLARPPWPPALARLLRERQVALRGSLVRAISSISAAEQIPLRGLLVWARLIARESERAQRALPDMARPQRFDALANAWQAWRTARRATHGRPRSE